MTNMVSESIALRYGMMAKRKDVAAALNEQYQPLSLVMTRSIPVLQSDC